MPIKIKVATDPSTIDAVLKIRHKVFSEEEDYFNKSADGRLIDRFDAYPTNRNLVVMNGEEVVGSLRLTLDSSAGVPADEYFDFRAHLPETYSLAGCGMYCVSLPYRSAKMALGLNLMASYIAITHDVTHVVAPVNPPVASLLKRVGFEALAEEMTDSHTGLRFIPMLLEVANLNDFFYKFAKSNQLYNFIGSYESIFYQPGEYVIHVGDLGEAAYVIIDGEAEVFSADSQTPIAVLGTGEVFGELALLIDDVRTASVVAKTELRVMSLAKTVFLDHLINNPEKTLDLLKSMGMRMKKMLS